MVVAATSTYAGDLERAADQAHRLAAAAERDRDRAAAALRSAARRAQQARQVASVLDMKLIEETAARLAGRPVHTRRMP